MMARIRTIKPEFWDSPGTARASLRARLFFIAMWNWADDWGVGDAHPLRLLSFAFPNDETPDVEPRNFRNLASEVAECFDVDWYEVDGRAYYSIPSWEAHQRTEKKARRRNPGPDQADSRIYGDSDGARRKFRDPVSVGKGKGEVGSGKGETSSSSEAADADPRPEWIQLLHSRPDIAHLFDVLDAEMISNGNKVASPCDRTKKNVDAARLMLDKDRLTVDQVERAIRWCQNDEFWRSNILSMSKLREKYDQLRLAAERSRQKPKSYAQQRDENALAIVNQYRKASDGQGGNGAAVDVRALDAGR